MAKYYRQHGETKQRKFLRFFRPVLLFLFIGTLIIVGWFIYDIFRKQDTEPVSSTPVSSTIVASTQIQTTPYFQFQTTNKWRAVANETRDGHYVYRQYNGPLVEQELVFDVNNQVQENLALTHITRVLPVTTTAEGTLNIMPTDLEHCKKSTKPGTEKQQQLVVMNKVTFPCNPDFTGYEIVLGLVGGTNIMMLQRPTGETAPYKIVYRNVSATPNSRDIMGIIRSFETR